MSENILEELKKGMLLTGIIPEPIMQSLKYLPFVVLDEVKKVELDYDINLQVPECSYIRLKISRKNKINLAEKEGEEKQKEQERIEYLKKAIQKLFWQGLSIDIQFINEQAKQ